MTVAIVDCGGENLRSVQRAVEIHKIKAVITNDKAKVSNASFVILPGVGSAQNVMQSLESKNLIETIKSLTQPVLGICIGMHILFDRSEEQDTECMKIISGNVKKFNSDRRFKVPQMGWNKVTFLKEQTKDLDDYYYFANSYYSQIINQTIATAEHSVPFTAAIQKNNFLGCQFHPEKSSFAGRKFLEYFFNKL
jgi:glutamine amidotransferase